MRYWLRLLIFGHSVLPNFHHRVYELKFVMTKRSGILVVTNSRGYKFDGIMSCVVMLLIFTGWRFWQEWKTQHTKPLFSNPNLPKMRNRGYLKNVGLVSQRLVLWNWNVYVTTGLCTIYYGIGNEVVFHKFVRLCIFISFFLLHEDSFFDHLLFVMKTWLSS